VPVADDAAREAARLGVPAAQFAAHGGEDYELLVALPPDFGDIEAERFARECGVSLTRIGRVRAGSGVRAALGDAIVPLSGYDHFG
jgi:thiamine-monophosphate kinase